MEFEMTDIPTRRAAFRKLHENFFILPNAVNAGEANALAELGFSAIVKTLAPKPVNVILVSPEMKAAELKELGVRRISVGGFLATAAWGAFSAAAKMLAETGRLPPASFG